jgi:hypothetical protein
MLCVQQFVDDGVDQILAAQGSAYLDQRMPARWVIAATPVLAHVPRWHESHTPSAVANANAQRQDASWNSHASLQME